MSAPSDTKTVTISVVIPVYRGTETLPELTRRLVETLSGITHNFEILLVNDASPDQSWSTISQLAMANPAVVRGIDLMKNAGQHNALLCGIRHARHEIIVTMDDDLQHSPEDIPLLLSKLMEGNDLVYGLPLQEPRSIMRNLLSRVIKRVILNGSKGTATNISSYRIFRTSLREAFAAAHSPGVFLDLLLSWGAGKTAEIRIAHETRSRGSSGYTLWKLISHTMNMLTSYSVMPLYFASMIGFLFVAFGMVVMAYTFADYLIQGRVAPGFTFLASIISIFSGTQLFAIGVVGLYLARIYVGMMARPAYVVRTMIGSSAAESRDSEVRE